VASFRKKNSNSNQLVVDGKHIMKPNVIADEFSKHFQSIYNSSRPFVFPVLLPSSEALPLASVSDLGVNKTIKH
jgi:hypothetical protein